jgi:hypothetical protein
MVALCEAYMGIEPHFDLWNYFFHTQLQQGLDMEVAMLGSVDIFIRSIPGVDPYFRLLMSDPPFRWWKVWFFLRNNTTMLLPEFIGSRPLPQPK